MGLAGTANQLWAWGTDNGRAEILRIDPEDLKIQARFNAPNYWQASGLAVTANILIFAPQEPNPPGSPKALVGIHSSTGKIVWEQAALGSMFTVPVSNERIACAIDSLGTLVAVHPLDGRTVWATFPQLGDYPYRGIPPALGKNCVLVVEADVRGGGLIAFEYATGNILWEFRPPDHARIEFAPGIRSDSAFVLAGEWLYRVSLIDGAWSRLSRAERKSSQGWYFAPPVLDEERVYLLEADFVNGKPAYVLRARDASTGQSLWQINLDRHPYHPPTISDQHVFFASRRGELICLNKQNGEIIWQEPLSGEPAGAPLLVNKDVYVLTKDGNLHAITFTLPMPELTMSPNSYEERDEWVLAAAAYLANGQPFEAGLSLLKAGDYKQAGLAFELLGDAEHQVRERRKSLLRKKNDLEAGSLSEGWGLLLLERLGARARGSVQVANWFEWAATSYLIANETSAVARCRELALKVMETPLIKLEVIAQDKAPWLVDEPVLLQVKLTNIGYGPARRIKVSVGGSLRETKSQDFTNLGVRETQAWENVLIIPNNSGAGVLEFTLDYESYRTRNVTRADFTHPIQVEKNQSAAIMQALQNTTSLHIEKFFSPGATHNGIEVSDSQGVTVGDMAKVTQNFAGRDMVSIKTSTGLDATEIQSLFDKIYTAIEAGNGASPSDKDDIKAEVQEIELIVTEAATKAQPIDETFLARRFRNIARMAPDILDVVVATISNPLAGLGVAAKKIAEKAKEEVGKE